MGTTSTENNGNSDMKQKSGEAEMSPSSKSKTDSSYNTTSSKSKSDREVPEKNNLNDFFGLGKYTAYVCLSYEIMLLAITFNLIFMTYGGAMTKVVGCGTERFENVNNFSQADFDKERCRLYNKLSESPGCTPMVEYEFYSVSTEFGIYCSEKARIKTSTSIQMAGLMAGAMLFGIISDKVGRKMALVIGFAGMSLLSILASFAWGILTFTAGRTLAMIFCGGVHCVSYCFMMESLPKKHRLWIITVVNISPNYILYATFAYLSHDWRTLSRVGGAIGICACISLLFDQETTVWMLNKEYYDSAQKSMETISRWDGKNTPERIGEIKRVIGKERDRVEKKKAEAGGARKKYYIYHLFTSWKLAVYAIFFAYSLMITSNINYGIMFNFEKIAGSIFVNTGMMGGLRWSVNIIMAIIDIRFFCAGRRLLHCVCMFFMAFLTMCITVIMMTGHAANFNQAMRVMALMNAATCTEVYVLNAVAPSELFPTPIRNSGISFIQVFNRVGNIVSPFLFTLADFWEPLPYVVMCGTCLIDAILYLLFIPETKGKELPDQMPGEEAAVDEKVAKGSKESKESRSSKSATSTTSEEE